MDSLEQQKQRLQVEAARVEELMAQVRICTAVGQLASVHDLFWLQLHMQLLVAFPNKSIFHPADHQAVS